MSEETKGNPRRITTNNWATFPEYPCHCGLERCKKALAVAPGVTPRTICLGIREPNQTTVQTYLDTEQAGILASELLQLLADIEAKVEAGAAGASDEFD